MCVSLSVFWGKNKILLEFYHLHNIKNHFGFISLFPLIWICFINLNSFIRIHYWFPNWNIRKDKINPVVVVVVGGGLDVVVVAVAVTCFIALFTTDQPKWMNEWKMDLKKMLSKACVSVRWKKRFIEIMPWSLDIHKSRLLSPIPSLRG